MEAFRPRPPQYHYDPSRYDTCLEQLGIEYPAIRENEWTASRRQPRRRRLLSAQGPDEMPLPSATTQEELSRMRYARGGPAGCGDPDRKLHAAPRGEPDGAFLRSRSGRWSHTAWLESGGGDQSSRGACAALGGKTMKKTLLCSLALAGSPVVMGGCTDAQIASQNLSRAADNFEILRRVVFLNGITDSYLLSIEGYCSILDQGRQLEVTCRTASGDFVKHFLGLSDNVTYFAEQVASARVSTHHYRVVFKPQTIIPDIDFRGSAEELLEDSEGR